MADYEFGIVPRDWLSLHMEIPQHFFTPTTSNENDDISIHAGTEECHDACQPKGPREDISMREAQLVSARSLTMALRWFVIIVGITFVQRPL